MALLVGPRGVLVYNDGYAAICDERHPSALGASVLDVWPEATIPGHGSARECLGRVRGQAIERIG